MASGGSKNLEMGERQFISSVLIITDVHNEIYAFYTEKTAF